LFQGFAPLTLGYTRSPLRGSNGLDERSRLFGGPIFIALGYPSKAALGGFSI